MKQKHYTFFTMFFLIAFLVMVGSVWHTSVYANTSDPASVSAGK